MSKGSHRQAPNRQQRMQGSLAQSSRRQFLLTLSSLGLAGMLPRGVLAASRRLIVVGAGLSGLQSALLLQQLGHEVRVLEARQRVGGRVYTLDDIPGHPEGGANTIGPNYGRVIAAAQRFGVELAPQGRGETMGLMINNQVIERENWPDSSLNTLPQALRAITPDRLAGMLLRNNPMSASDAWLSQEMTSVDISAATFFAEQSLNEQALQWLDVNNSYGNRLEDTSLAMLYRVAASISRAMALGQPALEAAHGNARIPEAMARELHSPVLMGHEVSSVMQSHHEVLVECTNGQGYEADALICALPATALRRIRFDPLLASEQRKAIDQLEYHKITQAHLLAETPYWQAAGEPSSWWTNGNLGRIFSSAQPNVSGSYNLTVWINGDACDRFDAMDPDEAGIAIVEQLQQQIPSSAGQVKLAGVVRWAVDPLNEGAWVVWHPGQISSWPQLLSQPSDRVFFAGEHTAVSNSGMEGAMESAERAVLQALRRLA